MDDYLLPIELLEQVSKGNCVLFLGTEWIDDGQCTWGYQHLATELLKYCKHDDPDRSITKVAQSYELVFGRQSLVERVCSVIEEHSQVVPTVDQIAARLPFDTVITTRIDHSLEEAYRVLGKSVVKIVQDKEAAFVDSQKISLFKIHGSVDQKESLVLTERDHFSIFKKRPIISEQVKVFFATKTVLFIGYNLENTYSKLLHREIVDEFGDFRRRAYAVLEDASEYLVQYWERENIKIIDCDALTFLQSLEQELSRFKTEHSTTTRPQPKQSYKYPYKFLDHFDTKDADLFFGREQEIGLLSQRVLAHRLMVVFGDSGVGKTSLIKAGAMPALKKLEVFPIYCRVLDSPNNAMEKAIAHAVAAETGILIDASGVSETPLLNLLMKSQQAVGRPIVLFIDQLEELFVLSYENQQLFIDQLAQCVYDDGKIDVRIVLSLRSDFLRELDGLREHLPKVFHNIFHLKNLSAAGAVEAIMRPLNLFSVKFEDALVNLLIKDLTSEGSIAPAQLQIVCNKLYEQFSEKKTITIEDYRSVKEARGILASYLEEVLGRFSFLLRGTAKQVLQALVSSRMTKKLLTGQEIAEQLHLPWSQLEGIVSELETYRLLRRVETEEGYKYELVHEYIVQQVWQWLSDQEAKIKEVQEIIDTETRYWPRYRTPLSRQKLDAVYECWSQLVLKEEHLELLFRSSVAHGRLKQWEEVAETLGQQLVPFYVKCLGGHELEVISLATVALAKLGASTELEHALEQMAFYQQSHARTALRQLAEGRTMEDMVAQHAEPEWKEKSLWNTSPIVGIDFGTTVSAIAVIRNDKPMIIPNREGSKFTPSVVAFTASGEVVGGTPAALQAATNPERTFFSIKRRLGTDWKIDIGNQSYTAVDIAVFIFKSLKEDAETYLQRKVSETVITVPAYFDGRQRHAVLEAARRAGFDVLRLVAEPTVAALAYSTGGVYDRSVAVYDLGGGTFDISLLDLGSGGSATGVVVEVKAINGNTSLGGDDFDHRIVHWLIAEFKKQYGIDLGSDRSAMVRLKEAAERAKITLSGLERVNIYIPYIYADSSGIKHLDVDLTRAKFEELTADLVKETIHCCEQAMRDAGDLSWGENWRWFF